MTDQVTHLSRAVTVPLTGAATVQALVILRLAKPEKYNGEPLRCCRFLLQCQLYFATLGEIWAKCCLIDRAYRYLGWRQREHWLFWTLLLHVELLISNRFISNECIKCKRAILGLDQRCWLHIQYDLILLSIRLLQLSWYFNNFEIVERK